MREIYEASLKELDDSVITLTKEVYQAIDSAIVALSHDDIKLARNVIENDVVINELENDINEKAISLITKQQPIATDLRIILSSIKIASDLERMGDNAASIAQIRKRVKLEDKAVVTRLQTMGKLGMLMLYDLENAYHNKDISLTKEVIDRDSDIDDLYKEIVNTTYLIDNDPFVAGQAHLAGRCLERIGDHITNIAESIYYSITGERYEKIKN